MKGQRLPPQVGEWIDRDQPIPFRFEDERLVGLAGDVISSALWANDVRMTGRSFKYHRPRGAYSMAGHDANTMLSDGVRTNLRGDLTLLQPEMDLHAVNTAGGVKGDRLRLIERFSKLMPVGFYYKAFHKPRWLFPFHERQMRKVAGLGRINPDFESAASPKDYAWCDVLVVGSGPSGLGAARTAAEAGLTVMIVEQEPALGGSLVWQHGRDELARQQRLDHVRALQKHPRVTIRTATTVGGVYADHWIALFDDMRMTKLRARAVVLATGAIEQPAVFGHNDVPGVMLASAAQRLVRHFAIQPFERAVVMAANSHAYEAALDLAQAGVQLAAVVDLRPEGEPSGLAGQVEDTGARILTGSSVFEARRSAGGKTVSGALLCPLDRQGRAEPSKGELMACDGIAVSVGWAPNASVLSQAGVRFRYDQRLQQLVPDELPRGVFVCGRANGVYELSAQWADGSRCGQEAARHLRVLSVDPTPVGSLRDEAPHSHSYPIFPHPDHKDFVDLDEDLHVTDFANAHQEGYDSVELIKRYSTVGMGPSQGKLANVNSVRILARLNGRSIEETGTTTARPFYQPVPLRHLAGRRFHPLRRTAIHDWHAEQGAVFVHAGDWLRPEYYAQDGASREDCVLSEATRVRRQVGLIDLSTLGKLIVQGPDAVAFLERIYTGRFARLAVGKSRYGVVVDESGVLVDDGVLARLGEDEFYATVTSSGAAGQHREMLRWALIWGLEVCIVNATGQLAAMNVAGPASRAVLQSLADVDLSDAELPYQGATRASVAGVEATIMRVGFVGELGYEVHIPCWESDHVWRAILAAGSDYGIAPFGVEAQRLLRLEKGHLIVGHDTDALTHPLEAGMGWAISRKKRFFVGQRSLQVLAERPLKRTLVGIRWPEGFAGDLPEECHLVVDGESIVGRVTSIAHRSTLGYPLGMAFVDPGFSKAGTPLTIRLSDGSTCTAQVAVLPFYDPENLRQQPPTSGDVGT
ncbi:MAG: glycine cleavage T C-terminal barrel domain-containing protein [Candidatus Latescibacterota bacterium]|nr:glycine cleavage T C-terminal barrel domain-containing protein [Candidatus Latescibacterota bacterium]